jgi:hypothetical protein
VSGVVNVESVVVAVVSASRVNTSVPTICTPLGVPAAAAKEFGSSCFAWNIAELVAFVNEVGTVSVSSPCERVPPVFTETVPTLALVTDALPVQPVVVKVSSPLAPVSETVFVLYTR